MVDNASAIKDRIPLLTTRAGPRDADQWIERLKEEYRALIKYVQINKDADSDWFKISSDKSGVNWQGTCWFIHNNLKYEFKLQFQVPVSYPETPVELELPELEGKTPKMYRGGKICLDVHFKPLWAQNVPHFGIAHALALGLGPWLAAEIPLLIDAGLIKHKLLDATA
ncbi:Ubiquitin-fold modifier-conjugating enzyme 1 [Plasmodiophora brassicae]|uniref:Ubiquitin-fold modifier-conjugating enzyme 1 n=1 Tax=Plasmodiophora brassicae TaxID=37360 RepID=A0A0G4ISB8_PLABS|nr:hypothetical protein PBRA_006178 [Plasmodiophora brassicae]SPQ96116.1 unnamed protein product [Plasmodiophora brassicae]